MHNTKMIFALTPLLISIAYASNSYPPANDVLTHQVEDITNNNDVFFISFNCEGHKVVDYSNYRVSVDGQEYLMLSYAPASLSNRATSAYYAKKLAGKTSILEVVSSLDSNQTKYKVTFNVEDLDPSASISCSVPNF